MIISLYLDLIGYLHPHTEGLPVHGASLSTAALLSRCARDPEVTAMEVFLPPSLMAKPAVLAEAAKALLGPERVGKGFLRFYGMHSLPEIWSDARPRILLCDTPTDLPRIRYLRDRFSTGPMAICCDTHSNESSLNAPMARMADAEPVPYDAVVCLSTRQRQFMRKLMTSLEPAATELPFRLETIPRGVDTKFFHPVDADGRRRARSMLGLPERGTITLFFGRLTPYTKADLIPLINEFSAACSADDYLVLVGREFPAGHAEQLRQAGAELGPRLIIRGEAAPAQRQYYYAASDLFVLPGDTLLECFGNAVLEAMACGLPVIVSDWAAFSEVVEDGVSGIVVPTWWMPGLERIAALSPLAQRNADHLYTGQCLWVEAPVLAAAIKRLLRASPEERAAMGAAARRRAESYETDIIHQQWRALWARQLTEAALETPEAAERRQEGADRLGLPSCYLEWFGHCATGIIGPTHRFRLSERGRAVLAQRAETLRFYDDLIPLLVPDIFNALFAVLARQSDWITCDALVAAAEARCKKIPDDIRFHLGLLLKRGLFEAAPPAQ